MMAQMRNAPPPSPDALRVDHRALDNTKFASKGRAVQCYLESATFIGQAGARTSTHLNHLSHVRYLRLRTFRAVPFTPGIRQRSCPAAGAPSASCCYTSG